MITEIKNHIGDVKDQLNWHLVSKEMKAFAPNIHIDMKLKKFQELTFQVIWEETDDAILLVETRDVYIDNAISKLKTIQNMLDANTNCPTSVYDSLIKRIQPYLEQEHGSEVLLCAQDILATCVSQRQR